MKITEQELKEIIKEEVNGLLNEIYVDPYAAYEYDPEAGMPMEISPHEAPDWVKELALLAIPASQVSRAARGALKGVRALYNLLGRKSAESKPETSTPGLESRPPSEGETVINPGKHGRRFGRRGKKLFDDPYADYDSPYEVFSADRTQEFFRREADVERMMKSEPHLRIVRPPKD